MLYLIGIGLNDEKDISVKGLEAVKSCDKVYLEIYTSRLACDISNLEELYGKKIILANRDVVEKQAEDTILKDAEEGDCAFLVIGDVFGATTHLDLWTRAKEKGINCEIIHNASILNVIGVVGLELYKYGKATSIPFENENVITPYVMFANNQKIGLHTLFLLDLRPDEDKFMTIKEAIDYLLRVESKENKGLIDDNMVAIGCSHLGSKKQVIISGKLKDLREKDYGDEPYCLIIPGTMHFMEEEALELGGK
ncbi:MAG: diphthine synthase [Nanoarchaeota archaeon]|nr:diphthine synthase [Nanoarchaeota archaeon]